MTPGKSVDDEDGSLTEGPGHPTVYSNICNLLQVFTTEEHNVAGHSSRRAAIKLGSLLSASKHPSTVILFANLRIQRGKNKERGGTP